MIEDAIVSHWLQWMLKTYIPVVMNDGCFSSYKILKLITAGSNDGATYSVQFSLMSDYWLPEPLFLFQEKHTYRISEAFGEKVLFFNSLLEEISLK